MTEIPFVKLEHGVLARQMEATLQALPDGAQLLFVSVSVSPTLSGDPAVFSVVVGCSRGAEEDAIKYLVTIKLSELLEFGDSLDVSVFRGVPIGA